MSIDSAITPICQLTCEIARMAWDRDPEVQTAKRLQIFASETLVKLLSAALEGLGREGPGNNPNQSLPKVSMPTPTDILGKVSEELNVFERQTIRANGAHLPHIDPPIRDD